MANLQKSFRDFHDAIAVRRDHEKALLAEKRGKLEKRLSEGIKEQREAGVDIPTYRLINQGSYAMGTGIKPKDGDYDLDVAVIFELSSADHPDPVEPKKWVFAALDGHTSRVEMRRPCVTVYYQANGEALYHLDFAIYAGANPDNKTYLALGKLNSSAELREWQASDPEALIKLIADKFTNPEDAKEFRRCIRYMKRWRDENFPKDGNAAPRGIALTACALRWFKVEKLSANGTTEYDDHRALKNLVDEMLRTFTKIFDVESSQWIDRLQVALPVPPGNDLFARLTAGQMITFRERLEKLANALDQAKRDPDPHTAATTLSKVFGEEFPIPEKKATATHRAPAIASSGNSG